ncbi:MAG: SPASM domain-containing protein [Candidatus Schekmanbacteria bacterium]|nr:SPASM domain-containing protein [Candidatus Schekmanbacteria bacterium]
MTKLEISEIKSNLHLLKDNYGTAVFHGESYRLFQVGGRIANALQRIEETPWEDVDKGFLDLEEELCSLQRLYQETKDEGMSDLEEVRKGSRCFYLFVSQECNLKCLYCYGDGGSYKKGQMLMGEVTLKNFFERCITERNVAYDILFFGGEPLLNLPLLKKAVEMGNQKKTDGFQITFNMVTNGTVFSPEISQFMADHINSVTISLDGPKEYHDLQRCSGGDWSSHDLAVETISALQAADTRLSIRTIVTKKNYADIEKVYRYNLGLNPRGVGITPVDVPTNHPLYLTGEEYRRMADEISRISCENLLALTSEDEPAYYEFSYALLERLYTKRKRFYACGAGRAQFGVAADGEVYPCHRFVGMRDFYLGNVNNENFYFRNLAQAGEVFTPLSVHEIEDCRQCWARYLCGGCCYLQSHLYKGSLAKPLSRYCYFKRKVYHDLLLTFKQVMLSPEKVNRLNHNLKSSLERFKGYQDGYTNHVI